jgi:hypothetical protein
MGTFFTRVKIRNTDDLYDVEFTNEGLRSQTTNAKP